MYSFFERDTIQPLGWMKRQLEIQANGLSGNLDKIWPDVRDSAWIGGSCEGWERVPYWLDGFVPLAYLLEDADMIARARRYIDAILRAQRPDGWICPCADEDRARYDTWAVLLISKVLTVYYDCSKDERVPVALYRLLKNYYTLLESGRIRLYNWGKFRYFEGLIAVRFIYARCGEDWLLRLAALLKAQGADYDALTEQWKTPLNRWRYETHIVNLAMMLKAEALECALTGAPYTDRAEALYEVLAACNGTPVGLFTGDECLSGLSPIQGTELCAVVEQMYSYEQLYACTGDEKWLERLELAAFNALPAACSDDMWAHQYVQMSCVIGVPDPYKMQKVKAFVKLAAGVPATEETKQVLLAYCRKNVAKYAMPYDIEFKEDMPKTLVGKVAYRQLEEEELAKIKAQEE